MFKIKDEDKLELETPETFFVSTKQLIDKKEQKNGQKVPSLEVVEVVLVHCNLVDNQY